MKKKTISILSAFMSLLMLCSLCLGLAGCAVSVKASDLMAGIESKNTAEPGPVSAGEADIDVWLEECDTMLYLDCVSVSVSVE